MALCAIEARSNRTCAQIAISEHVQETPSTLPHVFTSQALLRCLDSHKIGVVGAVLSPTTQVLKPRCLSCASLSGRRRGRWCTRGHT